VMTEQQSDPQDFTLANLYRDNEARVRSLFDSYRDIYALTEYVHTDEGVIPEAFEYAKKRLYFVILVLHTLDGRVFFQRSFDEGHLSMNLPGGSIRLNEQDTTITAIERIATRSIRDARLADIAPLIFLKNEFHCIDGNSFTHIGLGIRALVLNEEKYLTGLAGEYVSRGAFIKDFPSKAIPHPPSQETYLAFHRWFAKKKYVTYINELEKQHEVSNRYRAHQKYTNPILKRLSYIFGEYPIPEAKREIVNSVGDKNSCIDVACGDDQGIFDLLYHVKLVVANDISVDQLYDMERQYYERLSEFPKSNSLLFTYHDCLDLPFKDKAFDVAICRNLLHHMIKADDLRLLLDNLKRVAQKIIIVEIQDPEKEGFCGRLRHKLIYMKYLKDEGKHFYDKKAFENVLVKKFGANNISFKYFSTIRGVYMMAVVLTS